MVPKKKPMKQLWLIVYLWSLSVLRGIPLYLQKEPINNWVTAPTLINSLLSGICFTTRRTNGVWSKIGIRVNRPPDIPKFE